MGGNASRYGRHGGRPPSAMYWRRRFLVLVVGLGVLALVAWAFAGALDRGSDGSTVADVGHAQTGRTASPAAAAGGAPSHAPPGAPAPAATPKATEASTASGSGSPSASATPACKSGDIVLSVFASEASYGPGEPPAFNVAVVSTAAQTCALNIGPRYLALVITAGGKRVWGSADCAAAPGSVTANLARGVPAIVPVSWDRQSSSPGCPATAGQARAGTYAATASDGSDTSDPVTFSLA